MTRKMHLGLWLLTSGHHIASWRHPESRPEALTGLRHYVDATRLAERALFDMVFFEDTLAARERNGAIFGETAFNSLDPLVLTAALAAATERIGLAASCSTTYHSPQVLADKFAAIDRLSDGRAGWNMVTSGAAAARNFGAADHPEHAERYGAAHEVVHAVQALWKRTPTSRQGRPVLIQAGMSDWGLDFASAFGEAIFAAFSTLDAGRAFRSDLRARASQKGRNPDEIKILPGFMPIIGSTRREAQAKADAFRDLISEPIKRAMLAERFNIDFSDLSLEEPFPLDRILRTLEERPNIGGGRARFLADVRPGESIAHYAERMVAKPTGHLHQVGTPEDIADFMQTWFEAGGCDGFILQALQIPVDFALFVDEVVPILQARGVFRRSYRGVALRDHLGLSQPSG